MPTAGSPSREEWKDRLAPLLGESLQDVSEQITSHPRIQSWLQEASFEAARGLAGMPDMQARAQAYGYMLDQLKEHFAPLVRAVHDLTDGCGHLDLHWRPLEPNYSRIYVTFDHNFDVDVFYRLDALTSDDAAQALRTVKNALPKGTPFPNRPNEATGLVSHEGTCAGVRYKDWIDENGKRWRSVALLPNDRDPVKNLREEETAAALLKLFQTAG